MAVEGASRQLSLNAPIAVAGSLLVVHGPYILACLGIWNTSCLHDWP